MTIASLLRHTKDRALAMFLFHVAKKLKIDLEAELDEEILEHFDVKSMSDQHVHDFIERGY